MSQPEPSREAEDKQRAAWKAQQAARAERSGRIVGASIIGGALVVLNVAFYLLSIKYFNDKSTSLTGPRLTAEDLGQWRLAFGVFTGSVAVASIGTMFIPKWIGHGIAGIAALCAIVASYFAFMKNMPLALPVALLVLGIVIPLLIWRSLALSRAAWSFLVGICFVLALVFVFGAPKIRAQLHVGLWLAMVIPGLLAVAGVALSRLGRDYR
jgi:hypothetical protein